MPRRRGGRGEHGGANGDGGGEGEQRLADHEFFSSGVGCVITSSWDQSLPACALVQKKWFRRALATKHRRNNPPRSSSIHRQPPNRPRNRRSRAAGRLLHAERAAISRREPWLPCSERETFQWQSNALFPSSSPTPPRAI